MPDTDILIRKVLHRGEKVDSKHRAYPTHWPLPMIALGFFIGWFLGGFWWLAIPLIWLAHFTHDTIGVSGSIAWPAPFSFQHLWIVWDEGELKFKIVQSPVLELDQFLEFYIRPTTEAKIGWAMFIIGFAFYIITAIIISVIGVF